MKRLNLQNFTFISDGFVTVATYVERPDLYGDMSWTSTPCQLHFYVINSENGYAEIFDTSEIDSAESSVKEHVEEHSIEDTIQNDESMPESHAEDTIQHDESMPESHAEDTIQNDELMPESNAESNLNTIKAVLELIVSHGLKRGKSDYQHVIRECGEITLKLYVSLVQRVER